MAHNEDCSIDDPSKTPKCPVHGSKMVLTGHYDDGLVGGIQYWDDKYECPVRGCDASNWVSWAEGSPDWEEEE